MKEHKFFSIADFDRIKEAVKEAEKKISGEIVPILVKTSDDYPVVYYRIFGLVGIFIFLISIFIEQILPKGITISSSLLFLCIVIGGGLGALFSHFSIPVKRFFITRQEKEEKVLQKAASFFLREEVFNTKHRNGIMIFVSFFEGGVKVMPDKGIFKVAEQEKWIEIEEMLKEQLRKKRTIMGMEKAIQDCTTLLLEKGFYRKDDDENEIKDEMRYH